MSGRNVDHFSVPLGQVVEPRYQTINPVSTATAARRVIQDERPIRPAAQFQEHSFGNVAAAALEQTQAQLPAQETTQIKVVVRVRPLLEEELLAGKRQHRL